MVEIKYVSTTECQYDSHAQFHMSASSGIPVSPPLATAFADAIQSSSVRFLKVVVHNGLVVASSSSSSEAYHSLQKILSTNSPSMLLVPLSMTLQCSRTIMSSQRLYLLIFLQGWIPHRPAGRSSPMYPIMPKSGTRYRNTFFTPFLELSPAVDALCFVTRPFVQIFRICPLHRLYLRHFQSRPYSRSLSGSPTTSRCS